MFALSAALALAARSEIALFDFETERDGQALKACKHYGLELSAAPEAAVTGGRAMKIATKKWKKGMDEWPALNLTPPVADWTPYDRLCVCVVNPGIRPFPFSLYVTDGAHRVQDGLFHSFDLPAAGFRRYVIPLDFPKGIDKRDIRTVHFFLERPPEDVTLYVDAVSLLKKGEPTPSGTPPPAYLVSLIDPVASRALGEIRKLAGEGAGDAAGRLEADLRGRLRGIKAAPSPEALDAFQNWLAGLEERIAWLNALAAFRRASREAGAPAGAPCLVGLAPPTDTVLPQGAFRLAPARTIRLDLARNEKESVQVAVLPNRAKGLAGVSCRCTDLRDEKGRALSAQQLDCDVLGYVRTRRPTPYHRERNDLWRPDPILNFLKKVDIPPETAQVFWIRCRAPKGQPAGVYRGALTVRADGLPETRIPLEVTVRDFTLPDASPLPLAVTFSPEDSMTGETRGLQTRWRKKPDYPVNLWKRKKTAWADFLADYYITYDSLYHGGEIDFDILLRLHRQNRLGLFNLRYWHYFDDNADARGKWKAGTLAALRKNYARAKELGLLGHAYIYGCDESPEAHFPRIREAAGLIREACPGVPLLTTAYDASYGLGSGLGVIDGFCPLTPKYDAAKAQAARAAGKQVWWYICCGPHHPYANVFIEYPPVEARLLMGAMTARMRPDGFLYYQISIWNSEKPITDGPFTSWDPRSWTTYHGDGAWTCAGPGGAPLPTQRLENFRDGLEDYAYVRELERRLASAPPEAYVWAARAKSAIAVPAALVRSMTDYSRDGAVLLAWRRELADLIESAPRPASPGS